MSLNTAATGLRIDIDIGTPLFLEVAGVPGKFKSKLIGMDVGRFLIIATPNGQLPPGAKVDPDTFLKVRYVHHGNVFGFDTFVRGMMLRPARLLLVAYPKQVAAQSLRKAERFDCHIPCDLDNDDTTRPGTIIDISMAGCRCVVPVKPSDVEHGPRPEADVTLRLHTEEAGDVTLPAVIKNVNEQHGAAQLGISFADHTAEQQAALERVLMPLTMND